MAFYCKTLHGIINAQTRLRKLTKLSYHKREALHLSPAFDGVAALYFSFMHLQNYFHVLAWFGLFLNLTHQPEARK